MVALVACPKVVKFKCIQEQTTTYIITSSGEHDLVFEVTSAWATAKWIGLQGRRKRGTMPHTLARFLSKTGRVTF